MFGGSGSATESAIIIYCFNILCTFYCVVAFVELIKQGMPSVLLCYFHYSFERVTVEVELHSSGLALGVGAG